MKVKVLCLFVMTALLAGASCVFAADADIDSSNTFIVAHNEDAFTFDPSINWWNVARVTYLAYDALTNYDPAIQAIVPAVAKSWEVSSDGLEYTFYLNEGITFHDGTALTAADVKFSVNRLAALQAGIAKFFETVTAIDVLDEYTIQFTLPAPDTGFLASTALLFVISEDGVKANETDNDQAVGYLSDNDLGSGPYQVTLNIPQQRCVLEAFDSYWKGWEGEHIKKVVFLWITESVTQRLMLEAGEIDMAMYLDMGDLPSFEADADLEVFVAPSPLVTYISYRVLKEPLDDIHVREALAMAVDFDYYINVGTNGYGVRLAGPLPSSLPFYNGDLDLVSYDMTAAKALLADAGYPDGGFTLNVAYESGQIAMQRLVEMLVQNWGELGIDVNVMGMDWNARAAMQADPTSVPDIFLGMSAPSTMDSIELLNEFYGGQYLGVYESNGSYWSDPEVDRLIQEAKKASDLGTQDQLCKEIQRLIAEASIATWLAEEPYIVVARDYVQGYVYNPAFHQGLNVYDMFLDGKP